MGAAYSTIRRTVLGITGERPEQAAEIENVSDEEDVIKGKPINTIKFVYHDPTDTTEISKIEQQNLKGKAYVIWPHENCMMVGGSMTDTQLKSWGGDNKTAKAKPIETSKTIPVVWCIDWDYDISKHILTRGQCVRSGVCVDKEKSIILVDDIDSTGGSTVYTVKNIKNIKLEGSYDPVGIFEVKDPIQVFKFDKYKFGILCAQPSRIEIYNVWDVQLEDKIVPSETITLDLPLLGKKDRLCMIPGGDICMLSASTVDIYNHQGEKLYTLGDMSVPVDKSRIKSGIVFGPASVDLPSVREKVWDHGKLTVYLADKKEWALIYGQGICVDMAVADNDSKLYTICGSKFTVYQMSKDSDSESEREKDNK